MSSDARFDWVGLSVHFACGALLGAILGWLIWVEILTLSGYAALLCIGGGALTCGLAAAFWAERFWEHLPDWLSWW